ncbi:MAG: phospholipid carrier-dependent glycosyltransferase [Gemmatimonadetes bacterium]|jgi:hypothetical protein|nr:phospholipid carrier-dependent glycosyltransferase [Gemmatimonadota bacterium]
MRRGLLLALLLGIALLLRIHHLERWLPDLFEEAVPILKARNFWGGEMGGFDFNPHFFHYPALSFYIHFAFQAAVFSIGFLLRAVPSLETFRTLLETDWHSFALLGRGVTVLFDLCTILVAWLLGNRFGERIGPAMAALVAVNALHIRLAQYIIVDIPLVFFILLSLLFLLDVQERGQPGDFLKTGLAIGLATATKYTAALLVVPLIFAALSTIERRRNWNDLLAKIALSLGTAGLTFFLLDPFILFDFGAFFDDFTYERIHMETGHFGQNAGTTSILFYAAELWKITGIVGLAAVVALIQTIKERDARRGVLFLWIVIYLVVISTWQMRADRYLLPVVAVILLMGATAIFAMAARFRAPWRMGMAVVAGMLYLLPQGFALEAHYAGVSAPDTRSQARVWFQGQVPPGSLVALETYTIQPEALNGYLDIRLHIDVVDPQRWSCFYDLGWYENFDYIFISSFVYQRYLDRADEFPVQVQFYRDLEVHWQVAKRFAAEGKSGPTIVAFRNPSASRIDAEYNPEIYKNLAGAKPSSVLTLLRRLEKIFRIAGFEQKAVDVEMRISFLEDLLKRARNP